MAAASGAESPPAKRSRVGLRPEDLSIGQAVVYDGDKEGLISDAFVPLNRFWVRARGSGDLVRSVETGEVLPFFAEQLHLAPAPRCSASSTSLRRGAGDSDEAAAGSAAAPAEGIAAAEDLAAEAPASARVILLGGEGHFLRILRHFGAPDLAQRREPQLLLAVPCESCRCGPSCSRFDATKLQTCDKATCPLLKLAEKGVDPGVRALARRLRPDLVTPAAGGAQDIELRATLLKQAFEQLGPNLRSLRGHYCLSSVSVPPSLSEFEAPRRHIDLGVTAEGESVAGEASLEMTARRVLGEACGVSLSDKLWDEEVQVRVRKSLGVDLPTRFWDGPCAQGFVILLPSGLDVAVRGGLLRFAEPSTPSASSAALFGASGRKGSLGTPTALRKAAAAAALRSPKALLAKAPGLIGGKTVAEWKADQDQFRDLPQLPEDWIRVKSRNSEEVYFYNTRTMVSTFEFPLPDGWVRHVSKKTGEAYYFNSKSRKSTYELPTE